MKINDVLLAVNDGGRLSGRDHFACANRGLLDKHGKLTAAGKAAIAPILEARKASEVKAVAIAKATVESKKKAK